MKNALAVFAVIAIFSACAGNDNSANTNPQDSIKRASDSIHQTGDTSAMNGVMGDTTSASGIHGAGSGSRVGGGNTGAPQK